ncbi:conjugal transfer protein TraB [Thermococcus profundus]|uniref:Conjugal transfer protein TraB n=1 Tax=Thermococcus profundus TaxID=49899 RepID=A0A2Z2MBL7_THEPR|nr:TraB/GumN family protein [Thermococcus profundus]ASJ03216.1 conjugal transfer protein TraB [Thermococcus profundus]
MSYLRYVKVIGTMHVSPRSREEVTREIEREKPAAVAVELDIPRFQGLQMGKKAELRESLRLGRAGLVSYLLTKLEEKLGEEFGMAPGGEMLGAIETAGRLGIPVLLIDEDIRVIMGKILQAPLREKLFLILEGSLVFLPGMGEEVGEKDMLSAYRDMMREFKVRYPYLFRVLVEERNEIMALNLKRAVDDLLARGVKRPRIIAVVGMGHKEGIERILNSWKPERRSIYPGGLGNLYNPRAAI